MTGKRVFVERVSSVDGTLQVPVGQLAGAVYMVRMEEDCLPLQSQRLTIAH